MIKTLHELYGQRLSVQRQLKNGIINTVDAVDELNLIEQKERKIIKKLALEAHKTKDGDQRTINYLKSKGLFYTILPDRSRIYARTEEGLYRKLLKAYGITPCDMTLQGVFEAAVSEKASTDNNSEDTITHYRYDFQRFISKELYKRDIRHISKADLKAHTQEMVNRLHPKKKAFLAYKGVLNLIFGYAVEYDLIPANPVSAIRNSVYLKSCDVRQATPEEKILSPREIERVKETVREYMTRKRYDGYFINGYAILFAIETGCRAAEIPALKWTDIRDDYIHIHAQQLSHKKKGDKQYYLVEWTKDEKGISRGGRKFPLTDSIKDLLDELEALQKAKGISSEHIFCHEDGDWIKTEAYETCLRRLMKSLHMPVTNNHTFRMSLNSNVLIPLGISVTDRAQMLGHSVETNLRHYSFAGKDNINDLKALINGQVTPRSHQNVVIFPKKEIPKTLKNQRS